MNQLNQILKPVGVYKEVVRNINTGEVLDVFEERNVITDSVGINQIVKSFSDGSHVNEVVQTISLGEDIGTGTILNPEQPTPATVSSEHDLIYEVPSGEFFVTYPAGNSVRFSATVNGNTVMQNYPSQPNVVYTSAMLKTAAGNAFAYKRFAGRTISALISVDITWTIEFTQA